jgi:hypothetical protein
MWPKLPAWGPRVVDSPGSAASGEDEVDAVGNEPETEDQAPEDDHLVGMGFHALPGMSGPGDAECLIP